MRLKRCAICPNILFKGETTLCTGCAITRELRLIAADSARQSAHLGLCAISAAVTMVMLATDNLWARERIQRLEGAIADLGRVPHESSCLSGKTGRNSQPLVKDWKCTCGAADHNAAVDRVLAGGGS